MTTPEIRAIGYCVNYSEQGEWAFSLALDIARRNGLQLNIFHFVSDPYRDPSAGIPATTATPSEATLIEMEKQMRLHYDERLGDYLNVGFRLCMENEWTELHRCLCKREFQLLVLALPSKKASFGNRTLQEFAARFVCPVALVGPESADVVTLNEPARLIAYRLGLESAIENRIESPDLVSNLHI